ncbi:MAG: hypothetical protein IKA63_06250 [Clostridia bacterium]|nr:hypothetical protein [Clostridia bacterium]
MIGIRLADADELYRLYWELSLLTYLQQLIQRDEDGGGDEGELAVEAGAYLLDKQAQMVTRLKALLEDEAFGVPLGRR